MTPFSVVDFVNVLEECSVYIFRIVACAELEMDLLASLRMHGGMPPSASCTFVTCTGTNLLLHSSYSFSINRLRFVS